MTQKITGFVYFSPVAGRVVPRYGTRDFIGAHYVHGKGFEIDPQKVVAIPKADVEQRFKRAYERAVRDGSLIPKTQKDFDAYQAARIKADDEAAAARKKTQESKSDGEGGNDAGVRETEDVPNTKTSKKSGGKK